MAILMYTGGTTGLPKGVMMSHRNIMVGITAGTIGLGFTRDDATCFILPLFHVSFWTALCVLMAGGKVVINRKLDLNGILQLIQDEKCTHINAVPTIYMWLLRVADMDAYDLSSLRSIGYAGSPFPPETLKQYINLRVESSPCHAGLDPASSLRNILKLHKIPCQARNDTTFVSYCL